MSFFSRVVLVWLAALIVVGGYLRLDAARPLQTAPSPAAADAQRPAAPAVSQPPAAERTPAADSPHRTLLRRYCTSCHNEKLKTAGLMLDVMDVTSVAEAPEVWEKVVWKLRGGIMPPVGRPRPDRETINAFASYLESELDRAAFARPNPGRVAVHRLNRAEYSNAIRDLLALEINGQALLPADEVGHGFDNIAGNLSLSPALLERYMSAARRISRLAVGDPSIGPGYTSRVYIVPINMTQNDRMSEDLPFGSRAGLAVRHHFPLDGEYHFRVKLKKSVYEYVVNLEEAHDLDVRLDGARVQRFRVGGVRAGKPAPVSFSGTFMAAGGAGFPTQEWDDYRTSADANLTLTLNVTAGTHVVGVSFVGKSWGPEGVLQPPLREYGATVTEITDTSSRPEGPGIESVAIDGPYNSTRPGQTPSRDRIFTCRPATEREEARCARQVLSTLARRAFRRPVSDRDIAPLVEFYREGRAVRGFEGGIESALERLLVDPEFLFRVERDPQNAGAGTVYAVPELALASRLSFFLWSSIPDDGLLDLAERGKLSDPAVLERQVRRMLADGRSKALVQNFFVQWLQLRAVHGQTPDPNLFPEFDENLREAFARETELFLESQLREDRRVPELLTANYTFLNERLAKHYEVPDVRGSRFRRVTLADDRRGGLLGMGSVLMVTSYGNRTSPVLRAKWLLENLLGTPPPPPPGDVPPFPDERGEDGQPRSVRERLAQHRKNPACANCHAPMDPLGFALENFDAVGKWRMIDANAPIDASGVLVDGTSFTGPAELRKVLLDRKEQVVRTVVEKLLTYAIGRGLESYDAPVVRRIARQAAAQDYRWSSVILEVVTSTPFRMRRSES
jgi:mono/diheme cytochrome c family protein